MVRKDVVREGKILFQIEGDIPSKDDTLVIERNDGVYRYKVLEVRRMYSEPLVRSHDTGFIPGSISIEVGKPIFKKWK